MGRRKKQGSRGIWRKMLLLMVLVWFAQQGRFCFPRRIRPPEGVRPVEVTMQTTSYCHCGKCCSYHWFLFIPYQKSRSHSFRIKHVGETASGAIVRPGTIAADPSIYPFGTIMYIPGYGYGRVEDTGGAIKGQHIDLYRPNHWYARHWGVRTKTVKVWLPSKGQSGSFNSADAPSNPPAPPEVVEATAPTPSATLP